MTEQLPPEAYELGTPTAEYKTNPNAWRGGVLATAIGLAVACVGLVWIVAAGPKKQGGIPALLLILGVVIMGAGGLAFVLVLLRRNKRVLVFPDGLAYTKGAHTEICRWNDVAAVWQQVTRHYAHGVYMSTTHTYTVQRRDGKKFVFRDELLDVEKLGNTIQAEVTKRLLPRAVETYNSGGVVNFGKLSLSRQGLSNGKETIPWSQVKEVRLGQGFITVKKEGKWLKWSNVTVASTPNVFVFLSLVDHIVGLTR